MSCEPLIDANEAAAILRLHPKTVKEMAAEGRIPGMKIGSVWRFRASALDSWIDNHLSGLGDTMNAPFAAAAKGAKR